MKFRDIPQFITSGTYEINISLSNLENTINDWRTPAGGGLLTDPDFQRGHVWTTQQQIAFVEFFFQSGVTGRVIYFNKPSWQSEVEPGAYDDFVIVDGLQRLTALRMFMGGGIPAFGCYINKFEDKILMARAAHNLKFNVNSLKTRKEVLQWYLQMNAGGVVHTKEEIDKVKHLIKLEEIASN